MPTRQRERPRKPLTRLASGGARSAPRRRQRPELRPGAARSARRLAGVRRVHGHQDAPGLRDL